MARSIKSQLESRLGFNLDQVSAKLLRRLYGRLRRAGRISNVTTFVALIKKEANAIQRIFKTGTPNSRIDAIASTANVYSKIELGPRQGRVASLIRYRSRSRSRSRSKSAGRKRSASRRRSASKPRAASPARAASRRRSASKTRAASRKRSASRRRSASKARAASRKRSASRRRSGSQPRAVSPARTASRKRSASRRRSARLRSKSRAA